MQRIRNEGKKQYKPEYKHLKEYSQNKNTTGKKYASELKIHQQYKAFK